MADEELLQKIQGLDDLDLAALLCLINREHCIISTEADALDDLIEELQLVASETFNLQSTVVNLTSQTTLDDFAASILLPTPASRSSSPLRTRTTGSDSYFHAHPSSSHFLHHNHPSNTLRALSPLSQISPTSQQHLQQPQPQAQISNIILARDLDKAPKAVQIQALELLRTRRIFTRTSVQAAPKQFLFVAVLGADSGGEARLTEHLNDYFYVAHWHDPLDGFPRLEEREDLESGVPRAHDDDDDASSTKSDQSVVRHSRSNTPRLDVFPTGHTHRDAGSPHPQMALFSEGDLASLSRASRAVKVDVEVLRYQMNIVSFLRMHPGVGGGILPVATKHFDQLVRSLATLHGLNYVTPALVVLAARKIYMHRIRVVAPDRERSMQWGSELGAVELMLEGVGPEDIIEDVLGLVEVPL